ncbi:MAG: TAXI family TRAP transporter solute-binding subunit [Micrococcaceae bacterium]
MLNRRSFLAGLGAVTGAGLLSGCAPAVTERVGGLPRQMVWSTYSVGTGTYNDVAAVANALTNEAGIQIRLMSADTGVGRIGPTITRTASLGRVSVEYYYAFEGEDEYCSQVWGPQPIRTLWTPPGNYGIFVRQDSGIETVEDLKGRRVPHTIGNTAVNRNIEAMINYGGLTYDDVTVVSIAYSEQANALKSGQIEVMYENPTGTSVQELASQYKLRWLDFSSSDEQRFSTWADLVPMVTTAPLTEGAGVEPGEDITTMQYSIPFVTVADQDADEAYEFLSLLHRHYDSYRDVTGNTKYFDLDQILLDPMVTPFHEGAVRFLEEHGRWTPDVQARQEALLARERQISDAWPDFWDEYSGHDAPSGVWQQWKKENLPELPTISDVSAASSSV